MKIPKILTVLAFCSMVFAEEPPVEKVTREGWGEVIDQAGDCEFETKEGKLTVTVPGSEKPHDLSPELDSNTAPRVVQPLTGEFIIQVRVDGEFQPGADSTHEGRTGYTGAGLAVFADDQNFVRMERAALQRKGQEAAPYINFELRVEGRLERIGSTGDLPIEADKPTWLRLERRHGQLLGSVSHDGEIWIYAKLKKLTSESWNGDGIRGGIAAISTSRSSFSPVFSELKVTQGKAPEAEAPESE